MVLQSIFYVLAILFLILGIIAMSGAVVITVFLYIKLRELHGMLLEKLAYIEYMKNHPEQMVKNAALSVVRSFARKATSFLDNEKSEEEFTS